MFLNAPSQDSCMKTNYITGGAETSVAWNDTITTLEAASNKFDWSPCEAIEIKTIHMEVD